MAGFSVSKKSAYGVLFRDLRRFPLAPMGLPGGKRRKETLHSKVSESAAHVAGFGLHLEGFGPPNLPEGFFDSLEPALWPAFSLPDDRAPKRLCYLQGVITYAPGRQKM